MKTPHSMMARPTVDVYVSLSSSRWRKWSGKVVCPKVRTTKTGEFAPIPNRPELDPSWDLARFLLTSVAGARVEMLESFDIVTFDWVTDRFVVSQNGQVFSSWERLEDAIEALSEEPHPWDWEAADIATGDWDPQDWDDGEV